MSDRRLTCDETPLAWPASVQLGDLRVSPISGIYVAAPQPGSLQVLTRRQGSGVGDGVNITESNNVSADYRGQRYMLDEAILHVPGLHVFPGQKAVYPAEYHVHMTTLSTPQRAITIVIAVSHLVTGPGQDYFAAASRQPDPTITPPVLTTLLPPGTSIIQIHCPDLRGRTADVTTTDQCNPDAMEHNALLVVAPVQIRATDLERIPREGSLSTDPRDLPAPGIAPARSVPSDRLKSIAVLAQPGILASLESSSGPGNPGLPATDMQCLPLQVVDGNDVIDVDGRQIPLSTLIGSASGSGLGSSSLGATASAASTSDPVRTAGTRATLFFGILLGFYITYAILTWFVLPRMFDMSNVVDTVIFTRYKTIFALACVAATSYLVSSGIAEQQMAGS